MKITGYTYTGYIVEMTPLELSRIAGNNSLNRHMNDRSSIGNVSIGTAVSVNESWDRLTELAKTEEKRKRIAESLRAAATLIENTPPTFAEPQTDDTDDTDETS